MDLEADGPPTPASPQAPPPAQAPSPQPSPAEPRPRRAPAGGLVGSLLGAAGLIAAVTVLARLVGFGRVFVFSATVGYSPVGDLYQAVNTIPNIVFEIVAGGALASVVVPLLAAAVDRGDRPEVDGTASALLTWTVAVLTPLAVLLAVLAGPIVDALLDAPADGDLALGRLLLVVFAPQLVLYGIGIVLTGVLQSHRRFVGPALAPLLSSVTVVGAYLVYGALDPPDRPADLPTGPALVLAVGTTLGVVVLALGLLVPLRRTGVRLRPTFRFPAGAARSARRLVGSGVAAVVGQQVALLVALKLALAGPDGTVVAFTVAQTVFLLPWAVLAVPVATAAFPRLTAAWAAGDRDAYASALRAATTTVLVASGGAAAALAGAADPVAAVVTAIGRGADDAGAVAAAVALFAPGLLGYGLLALLTRALYAAGRAWSTALVVSVGWAVVVVADVVLARAVPEGDRVAALAAGNTLGMLAAGIGLVLLVRRAAGPAPVAGVPRLAAAVVVAATLGACAGRIVAGAVPGRGTAAAVGEGALAGLVALAVFVAVASVLDRGRLVPAMRGVRAGRRADTGAGAARDVAPAEQTDAPASGPGEGGP